jgi:hypothetical protein
VEVAKARRLLTFFIDETELDCSSIQSMITTIENEHGQVKSIALDGISLLEKKTAEVTADATIRTFSTTQKLVSDVKSAYVSALINQDTSPLAGMSEHDWHSLLYLPKGAGTKYFSWVLLFIVLVGLTDGLVHSLIFTLFSGG